MSPTVSAFKMEEDAIRITNTSAYGLAATVFSTDINVAIRVARAV